MYPYAIASAMTAYARARAEGIVEKAFLVS